MVGITTERQTLSGKQPPINGRDMEEYLNKQDNKAFHEQGQIDQPPPTEELEKVTILRRGAKRILTGSYRCNQPEQGIDPCHKQCQDIWAQQWALKIELTRSQRSMRNKLL